MLPLRGGKGRSSATTPGPLSVPNLPDTVAGGFGDFSAAKGEDRPLPRPLEAARAAVAVAAAGGTVAASWANADAGLAGAAPPSRNARDLWLLQMPTSPAITSCLILRVKEPRELKAPGGEGRGWTRQREHVAAIPPPLQRPLARQATT